MIIYDLLALSHGSAFRARRRARPCESLDAHHQSQLRGLPHGSGYAEPHISFLCIPKPAFHSHQSMHSFPPFRRPVFVHQIRGFSSQLIYGESFEKPQANVSAGKASNAWSFFPCEGCGSYSVAEVETVAPAKHGASSRLIGISQAGTAPDFVAKLVNRGLGNEGFYLEAGKPYEGYLFARCARPVTLSLRLERYETGLPPAPPSHAGTSLRPNSSLATTSSSTAKVLAEKRVEFACGSTKDEWVRLEFELTMPPYETAECTGIAVGSDASVHCTRPTGELGHSCVRCAGQFAVGLASVGSVSIDYVVLQPGVWGRLEAFQSSAPLPMCC